MEQRNQVANYYSSYMFTLELDSNLLENLILDCSDNKLKWTLFEQSLALLF